MHLAEQRRRDAEPPGEGLRKPRGREQADPARHQLERQAAREQQARGGQPGRLDEPCRRFPGCRHEFAVKGPFGQARAPGERGDIQRLIEIGLYPSARAPPE